jgi:hypothetical protein
MTIKLYCTEKSTAPNPFPTIWAGLFEIHVCACKVLDHIIPEPRNEKSPSAYASFEMWTIFDSTVIQRIYSTVSIDILTTITEKGSFDTLADPEFFACGG